jgi:hypothetical protein
MLPRPGTTGDRSRALLPRVALGLLLAAALGVRLYRSSWGLPEYVFPDGVIHFVRPAARLAAGVDLVPQQFLHPPVLVYALGAVYLTWSHLGGRPIDVTPRAFPSQLPALVRVGRAFSAIVATACVAVLYLLGRRLVGTAVGLLAAALFAFSPVHVLEGHRVNPDGLMILLGLVATLWAVVAADTGRRGLSLAAFAAAGFAGGTKYTGLSAVTVPAWLALRAAHGRRGGRVATLALGLVATGAAFAFSMAPGLFNWPAIRFGFHWQWHYNVGITQPGLDLAGQGWTYTRYVYPLVVALPYTMGWPLYVAGLAGLAVVTRHPGRLRQVLGAAIVPFALVQGAASVVVARYYLPLVPYLALAAAVLLARIWQARRAAGAAATAAVLGYTILLAASQCARLGLGPQRAVGALLAERARAAVGAGRPFVVAYPDPIAFFYDAVRPGIVSLPQVKVIYVPEAYRNLRAEPDEALTDDERLSSDRRWVSETEVDAVVLPSWVENAVLRERPAGYAGRFYRRLADGRLGFRLAADFRSHYCTERLYVWADPMLDTHWETGIAGYKVFLRAGAPWPYVR